MTINQPLSDRFSDILASAWWLVLLRGIAAVVFGVLTLIQPEASLVALLLIFSIYAIADGVIGIWTALSNKSSNAQWWVLLLWGVVSVLAGILALVAPGAVLTFAMYYIAFWALITGVLQIAAAIRLRKEVQGEWMLILAGLLSVVFGVLVIVQPIVSLVSILWLIGLYALFFGVLLVGLAFKVRRAVKA